MATSNPRYGLNRTNAPGGPSNSYNPPAAAFSSTGKTQQRLEAERLERDRKAREEQQRMEALGQNSLQELSEEQREEIGEAVRIVRATSAQEGRALESGVLNTGGTTRV
jgi:hypothetical protein